MTDREKIVHLPTCNVSLGQAVGIFKDRLDDDNIATESKVLSVKRVTYMETHNGITKAELIKALRWLFDNYEF